MHHVRHESLHSEDVLGVHTTNAIHVVVSVTKPPPRKAKRHVWRVLEDQNTVLIKRAPYYHEMSPTL